MGAVESSFDEIPNIFDTGGSKGLPGDSVEKIPKIIITSNNNVDASGEKVSCSVCLQVKILKPYCFLLFFLLSQALRVAVKFETYWLKLWIFTLSGLSAWRDS